MNSGFSTVSHDVSAFHSEDNGVWTVADWNNELHLAYIKTRNTTNNRVEVHMASAGSDYRSINYQSETAFTCEDNGVWSLAASSTDAPPDLIYTKTRNTSHGRVEIHVASGASHYSDFSLHQETTFGIEEDGVWAVDPYMRDLGFVKTANTGDGNVELHIASASSGYLTRILETPTGFAPLAGSKWSWLYERMDIPAVTLIKATGTDSNFVEVQTAGWDIQTVNSVQTPFACEDNGYWSLFSSGNLMLIYVKTRNTPSGMVEVHIGQ